MESTASLIVAQLQAVEAERQQRAADPALAARVDAVKRFQHRRFQATYADLSGDSRYAGAAQFFLDDLYGPHDFSERDAQFARIVPALVRLFPGDIVSTVGDLASLHALSEQLDTAMGRSMDQVTPGDVDQAAYARAWRAVGSPERREQQIELMLLIGRALDRYTRNPVLRHSLRMMRKPARAAGLGALQQFLETGFDTFRAMKGADEFLRIVAERERELARRLFEGADTPPLQSG
jgi:hypothetical protein